MMNDEQLFLMLKEILVETFELDESEISLSSNLYEDLDLDSIDAVDLVVKLREQTGKKIEPADFKQVRTVSDVLAAIKKLLD